MAVNQKVQYFRNKTNHCYLGRPMGVPKWVRVEACPPIAPGGTSLALGPHDEEPSDNGTMELVVNNGHHFVVCCIGSEKDVNQELDLLGVVPLDGRVFNCSGKSPDGKEDWISRTFVGAHHVLAEVTHEKKDAIALGGTITATQNVVRLQEQAQQAEREVAILRAKLAAIEEKAAADAHKGKKGAVV